MKLFHRFMATITKIISKFSIFIHHSKNEEIDKRTRAIAFVDFEHWYYSYKNLFHMKPNIFEWRKELEEKFRLDDIMVFANFKERGIREELTTIRSITNSIIETQQCVSTSEKDMTDFIMLDYIYQYVEEHPNTDTYIIFTGDAHFQSVIKYLIQKRGKKVIVYGVKGAFSNQLKKISDETIEVPATENVIREIYPLIVENMNYVSSKFTIVPTFLATARTISEQHNIPEELVRVALNDMIRKGLLYSRKQRVEFNRFVPVLAANWDALVREGLWKY